MIIFDKSKVDGLKKLLIQSGVGFLIRCILDHAERPLVDLQKRPSLNFRSDLVESIGFAHIFLKLVALV